MIIRKSVILLFLLFLLHYTKVISQTSLETNIANLKIQLNKEKPVQKVSTMIKLCYDYFTISVDSSLQYGFRALKIARALKNDTLIGRAYLNIGHAYFMLGKDSLAFRYLNSSADICRKHGDTSHLANTILDLGQYYLFKGDYTNSLKSFFQALYIYKALNKSEFYENAMMSLYEIGEVYTLTKKYTEALKYLHYSLKLADARNDTSSRVSVVDMSVGDIYFDWKQYQKALEYYKKACTIDKNIGDKNYMAYSLVCIGNVYFEMNSIDTAYYYNCKAVELYKETGDKIGLSSANENIGNCFREKKNYTTALSYYTTALRISEQKKEKDRIADLCHEIGKLYFSIKDFSTALTYSKRSLAVADTFANNEYIYKNYLLLSDIYSAMDNCPQAFYYYKQYITKKDSIFNEDIHRQISDIQEKYETDKRKKEIKILKQNEELQNIKIRRQKLLKNSMMIVAALMLILALVIYRSFRQKRKANIIIAAEKKKSDDLLLNILPEQTAEELKEKGYASTRYYEMVTVLFTDFAGFTTIAEKMTPEKLVAELDYCFKEYDRIVGKHKIEKIKTIGDSYMCAGGLPEPNTTNPSDVVKCGLEICSFMQDYKKQRQEQNEPYFEIRIGIHTGPVVSGIVGTKKFAYDIWGDTVNTAARMESSGKPGFVNISGITYQHIKDEFKCSYRGKVEAKNKGTIDMFFVECCNAENT